MNPVNVNPEQFLESTYGKTPKKMTHPRAPERARTKDKHMTTSPRPLVGPQRQKINKLVHEIARQIETRLRADLLARAQAARDNDDGLDTVDAIVKQFGEQSLDDLYEQFATPEREQAWAAMVSEMQTLSGSTS